ncbi:MAG: CcmD family protein, partial [Bacteroidota bacterium]
MNRFAPVLFLFFASFAAHAQDASATTSSDKMNVVVGVLLIVLGGIFIYLILLEKKLNRF